MKIISIQEACRRKFERQKKIKALHYHASGHCVHIGKLSPGCRYCFEPSLYEKNIITGNRCNLDCPYCTTNKAGTEPGRDVVRRLKAMLCEELTRPDYIPSRVAFSGGGEPLLYLDDITGYMEWLNAITEETGKRPWYYLYTNGLLAGEETLGKLKDLGLDEIRFHLGATNFSKKAYANLKKAIRTIRVVTVETPAWPPHRKKLFEMLPLIDEIGVKHLNIGEVEVNPFNHEKIRRVLPRAEIYQYFMMHLYDGGLVYDIMEEVLRKTYSYSVLDCNCFVKSIQRAPGKSTCYEKVAGLCAQYR